MVAMRFLPRFIIERRSRARGVAIVALAAALVSTVPAATYRCSYGMVEAGPMCPLCHGETRAAATGESAIDRGPCCSSAIVDAFATTVTRDHSRDVPETQASEGWLALSSSPLPSPPIACPRAPQPCPGNFARSGTLLILRL